MSYFNNITNSNEAKLIYRRLAMLNHPDLGGNPEVMARINNEYNNFKKSISKKPSEFETLQPGDYVIINTSKSRVISVSQNTFIARSEFSKRQAVFSIQTGICTTNPKFKAIINHNLTHAN